MGDTRSFTHDPDRPARNPRGRARLIVALESARPLAAPRVFALHDAVTLGRRGAERDDAEERVDVDDAWLSARHARLARDGDTWGIEDLKSKNGTFVNIRPAAGRVALRDGDVIEAGGTMFVFRAGGDGPDGETLDERRGLRTLAAGLAGELRTLGRIARSTVPVLLHGESGTGKELLALAIHELSARCGPFVAINCGALPPTLVGSELFGARKGAYSGALDRPGLVVGAHQGTLFLDEIAELPEAAQTALLRALQEGEVRPLAAPAPVKVDLRVVAATHQDLAACVDAGRFRQDLYARLRGYRVTLPPLRERREDLGLIIADLVGRLAPERAATLRLHRLAARALFAHDWPLNVRELEQTLRAALAIAPGDEIELEHLPEELREAATRPPPIEDRAHFLELARGLRANVSAIARALNTSRSHVRRLAQRFGVDLVAERVRE
jgi:MoxR-like ATPase